MLGVCVNLSARFMCHPICDGSIVCDEELFEASRRQFEFKNSENPTIITVKGTPHPLNVYHPVIQKPKKIDKIFESADKSKNSELDMIGRKEELQILQDQFLKVDMERVLWPQN